MKKFNTNPSSLKDPALHRLPLYHHQGSLSQFTFEWEVNRPTYPQVIKLWYAALKRKITWIRYKSDKLTFGIFYKIKSSLLKILILILGVWLFKGAILAPTKNAKTPFDLYIEKSDGSTSAASFVPIYMSDGSSLAPASPEELEEKQCKDYIKHFAKIAITEMDKFGIPASIKMAQGLLESHAGHSSLAVKVQNHFGIKCFSHQCKKGHCVNFTDDHHKDFFRKYSSAWISWREHSEMLVRGKFRKLLPLGKDYRKWARGLKELGYATDKNYDEKLIDIIEKYELYKLDEL